AKVRTQLLSASATTNEQKVHPRRRDCQRDRDEPQSIPTGRCGSTRRSRGQPRRRHQYFPDTLSDRWLRRLLRPRNPYTEIIYPEKLPALRLRPPPQLSEKNDQRNPSHLSWKYRASFVQRRR